MKQINLINCSIAEMQAEVFKVLISPKRIEILSVLKDGEKTVGELAEALGASRPNVSQHLAVMRHLRVLSTRRDGTNVYYRVSNLKVHEACALMKEVLLEKP